MKVIQINQTIPSKYRHVVASVRDHMNHGDEKDAAVDKAMLEHNQTFESEEDKTLLRLYFNNRLAA